MRLALILSAIVACNGGPTVAPQPSAEPEESAPPPEASAKPSKGYATHTHSGAGVAFELDDAWELSGEESSTLLASSPDGQALLMFHVSDSEGLEAALATIRAALQKDVEDVYFGPAEEKRLGTMTAELATGAGRIQGRPVELGQLLVATPKGKVLVVVAVVEAAAPPVAKRQARHTLESIRPVR